MPPLLFSPLRRLCLPEAASAAERVSTVEASLAQLRQDLATVTADRDAQAARADTEAVARMTVEGQAVSSAAAAVQAQEEVRPLCGG